MLLCDSNYNILPNKMRHYFQQIRKNLITVAKLISEINSIEIINLNLDRFAIVKVIFNYGSS